MKIDIHMHTKKTKQGDAVTRNIEAKRFHEIISSTEVRIVAITNHNVFDSTQYHEFVQEVDGDFQIWPGVELDVIEDDRRGHLIVIVSPRHANELENTIFELSKDCTPDTFNISIKEVINNFDKYNPIYIAHYQQKKPDLLDEDIDYIVDNTVNKNRVLKEATNAVSAGIFISHGHASIYGSDVQNWEHYQKNSKYLPDLRLSVESFEQFCLLLDKDQVAIETLLDKKHPEKILIEPFKGEPKMELLIYDDINILFGAKGTGKSEILAAISHFYSKRGVGCNKFESGSLKLEDAYDLSGKNLNVDLQDYGIDYCNKEIKDVRSAREVDITSLSRYKQHFSDHLKNTKAKRIKIKDFQEENIQLFEREFKSTREYTFKLEEFITFVEESKISKEILDLDKYKSLIAILKEASTNLEHKSFERYSIEKETFLFNGIINKFRSEVARKTGTIAKPSETGFKKYAANRIKIEIAVRKILTNIQIKIEPNVEYVGCLDDKGELYCRSDIAMQDGSINDSRFKSVKKVKKGPQKKFSQIINNIQSEIYSDQLFDKIAELNEIEDIETIPTLLELLVFNRYFTIDDIEYSPSTGEASMILLHQELNKDMDVYILDEPEKSLGNEYINNVIVPLIKEKAKGGKKIFIATHDANIAVRTLPYNSIFRSHSRHGYKTYVGNPFSDSLLEIKEKIEALNWKDISMRTLEGGKDAFGERGQIYGNI